MRDPVRLTVRVQPGASRTFVGGDRAGMLLVRVTARAVEGAANRAVVEAVASALGVRPRQVHLVGGTTHREKVLEVTAPPDDLAERLERLRSRT